MKTNALDHEIIYFQAFKSTYDILGNSGNNVLMFEMLHVFFCCEYIAITQQIFLAIVYIQ